MLGFLSKNELYKMLKKFTDFTNEKNGCETPKKEVIKATNVVKEPVHKKTPKVKDPVIEEPKMENFEFIGKIVKFPSKIKPSVSIVMLENNNISKDKLHYIISKQTLDSLVILKYNEKAEMKLTEFVNTLIGYYKRNPQLKTSFDKILVEGNESYSIIKNIPNIQLGDRKMIDVLNDDLIKLLK